MPHGSALAFRVALLWASGASACATTARLAYTPEGLRAEVARVAPEVPAAEIVVPFEITEAQGALARRLVAEAPGDRERLRILTEALFDPALFGLRYSSTATVSAKEALRTSEGNCLSLASVLIGLARAVGLSAYYMDASTRVHETRYADDGTTVNVGHVTAMVQTPSENIGLDVASMGRIRWYRVMDDVEALAHYYNNRGFDLVDRPQGSVTAGQWEEAAHSFWLAVQVRPGFAQAWNNLGIAAERLGRHREAMGDYRAAIERDPKLGAPYNNLGSLYLKTGDVGGALKALETAAKLEPRGPHIQYNLAVARIRHGDRAGAVEALRRAIELRAGFAEATALLDELTVRAATLR